MAAAARSLAGRTMLVTGGSRGIGLAIAKRAAADGANIIIAAKTAEPHPTLPGTIFTAAKECEEAGARKAIALQVDIMDDNANEKMVEAAVAEFGGIDILVNNASAIDNSGTLDLRAKKYQLMVLYGDRTRDLLAMLLPPADVTRLIPVYIAQYQWPWHLLDVEALPAALAQGHQPARAQSLTAPGSRPSLVQDGRRGVHNGQVQHVHVCNWHGRGIQRPGATE